MAEKNPFLAGYGSNSRQRWRWEAGSLARACDKTIPATGSGVIGCRRPLGAIVSSLFGRKDDARHGVVRRYLEPD